MSTAEGVSIEQLFAETGAGVISDVSQSFVEIDHDQVKTVDGELMLELGPHAAGSLLGVLAVASGSIGSAMLGRVQATEQLPCAQAFSGLVGTESCS
jgi:hypothetical protein